jgi:hypothetical protein
MPSTNKTLEILKQRSQRTGVLVPLLEDFMTKPVNIKSEKDVQFLTDLLKTMAERERRRDERRMYSPSSLAQCLRKVYLLRHHEQLEIKYLRPLRREPNFYFLNGNFLHLKWQFAMWKMERHINDPGVFEIHGFEVPVESKRGDHGGTADVIVSIHREPFIVDLKGINVRSFGEITRGFVPGGYEIQLADYMILWNSQRPKLPPYRIEKAILLTENKGGPDAKHPLALHETEIRLEDIKPVVTERMEVLRSLEHEGIVPPIECTSTGTFQFAGCPFQKYCKKEVQKFARERKALASSTTAEVEISTPTPRRKGRVASN